MNIVQYIVEILKHLPGQHNQQTHAGRDEVISVYANIHAPNAKEQTRVYASSRAPSPREVNGRYSLVLYEPNRGWAWTNSDTVLQHADMVTALKWTYDDCTKLIYMAGFDGKRVFSFSANRASDVHLGSGNHDSVAALSYHMTEMGQDLRRSGWPKGTQIRTSGYGKGPESMTTTL